MVFHIKPLGCWEETCGTQRVEAYQAHMLSAILDKNTLPEMPAVEDWTGRARLYFGLPTEGKEDVISSVVGIAKTQLGREKRPVGQYRKEISS